jgi:preprotein translocase subunit SecG
MNFWRFWALRARVEADSFMLRIILTIVQVFSSLAIIALVLLQRGKGAEAGAGFGAGASGTVFGARGASTALSRATAIFAAVFMLNSLLLTYMGTHVGASAPQKSILDTVGEKTTDKGNTTKLTVTPTAPAPAAAGSSGTPAPAAAPVPAPAAPASAPSAPAQPAPEPPK